MLFNSYIFIFFFLPVTAIVFHLLRSRGWLRAGLIFLVLASLFFYGLENSRWMLLLCVLIFFNFFMARRIQACGAKTAGAKALMIAGVAVNLGALGYYKYANFFVDNLNAVFGLDFYLHAIVLPVGISFFTFQKIAFLVDMYQGKIKSFTLLEYSLFVTFFPQLIAGPIVHHSEMMPQFGKLKAVTAHQLQLGITTFVIGLSKKVILADTASRFVSPVFSAAASGTAVDPVAVWCAVLCYTAQLYFDFSAYSDMAIGIGQLFGINLPLNFHSPYKATSIIDFWRRWHMTLSRFLRDYIYIPLGGNRNGKIRRYMNLMATMLLGGIWHGAGWTFFVWGFLHGAYLMINHGWHAVKARWGAEYLDKNVVLVVFSWIVTFVAVMIGWIFFRSADLATALRLIKSMVGLNQGGAAVIHIPAALITAVVTLGIAFLMPNTQQIMRYAGAEHAGVSSDAGKTFWQWRPSVGWAVFAGCLFAVCLMLFSQVSEFIYFQF